MEAPIVTLTTDWGTKDFFAGMVKGKLYSSIPNVRVVDICHGINQFSILCATFVVKNGCLGFPPGTIHIIDVNSEPSDATPFIVVEYKQQFFICTDNGLPYSVFGNQFTHAVRFNLSQENESTTFVAYTQFCEIAIMLANGKPITELGTEHRSLVPRIPISALQTENQLNVRIAHIDSYGNAYLNITYSDFLKKCNGRQFTLHIQDFQVSEFSKSYGSWTDRIRLLVSATGYLQVAIPQTSAAQLLGINEDEVVFFTFHTISPNHSL